MTGMEQDPRPTTSGKNTKSREVVLTNRLYWGMLLGTCSNLINNILIAVRPDYWFFQPGAVATWNSVTALVLASLAIYSLNQITTDGT